MKLRPSQVPHAERMFAYMKQTRAKALKKERDMPAKILNEPVPDHYKGCFDREAVGHWDLAGKDVVVTIKRVAVGKLRKVGDEDKDEPKMEKKIILWFDKADKYMICNITNAETIAGIYGPKPKAWEGKRITLYATQTRAFGKVHDCIRVRPTAPKEGAAA